MEIWRIRKERMEILKPSVNPTRKRILQIQKMAQIHPIRWMTKVFFAPIVEIDLDRLSTKRNPTSQSNC